MTALSAPAANDAGDPPPADAGADPERAALMAEETPPLASPAEHRAAVIALKLCASPLAGVPGALPCRGCGRAVWCSPSWKGPPPADLCAECYRGGVQ